MNQTTLTNIDIPFWRLTGIILKFMLASIPAILLLYLILAVVSVVVMIAIGGIVAGSGFLEEISGNLEQIQDEATPQPGSQ